MITIGITVLSLFDGKSGGQISLDELGIKVDKYLASEIKPHAIKVTQHNFPNTIQLGDVTKVKYVDGVLYSDNGTYEVGTIDLVIGGSPCQNFSMACIKEKRLGLEGEKSKLFYEFLRILEEVKPKYYLLENVASMDKSSQEQLNEYMGVKGFMINSLDVLPQIRKRLYWTNIPFDKDKIPKRESSFNLQSILEHGYTPKEYSSCLLEGHSRPTTDKLRLTRRHLEKNFIPIVYESKEHYEKLIEHYNTYYRGKSAKVVDAIRVSIDNSIYDGVRILTALEMERLQGVPEGYTSVVSRNESASLLGDGWSIPVIKHILKGLDK